MKVRVEKYLASVIYGVLAGVAAWVVMWWQLFDFSPRMDL